MDTSALAQYIAALLIFGTNGTVASHIPLASGDIVFLRTLIGSIFLAAVCTARGGLRLGYRDSRDLAYIAASGAAMDANWMFLYEAYARVGVSVASLANYCGPVIMIILSPIFLHERLTWLKAAVFAVVIAGMMLVSGGVSGGTLSWGLACGLLLALMYAFMVIFYKKAEGASGMAGASIQLIFAFVTVLLYTFAKHGLYFPPVRGAVVPILVLGAVNTGIGCCLYFAAASRLAAGVVGICGYLEPLSALVFSAFFLGERLTPVQLVGAALIIGGAAFYTTIGARHETAKG